MTSEEGSKRARTDLVSFIEVSPESDFPIQNIPFGVFSPAAGAPPRVGTAIGDFVRGTRSPVQRVCC